ncbi:endonuclease [Lysobacter hankyongensis]|uniref:Endonuclease n=1 Tax=Lysobacter hankyongensis TaxID=1176535 RepID=A0ABP9B3A7_9GAMM
MSRVLSTVSPLACALLLASGAAQAEVFINEFHYDDSTAAGDTGERIEVVATAGETLSSYRVYLYNGSTPTAAVTYDNDLVPAGSLVTCGSQVRIATLSYATNGIQNGSNDGIALVNPSGQVVQFISYEGQIKASNGPAAGLTSTNLSVSETGSDPAGRSLRLAGTGTSYSNFSWQAPATATFGACNTGQTFSSPNTAPTVVSTTPANGATNFPAAGDLNITFSESVTTSPNPFTLTCATSGGISLIQPASGTSFTINTGTALVAGEACTFTAIASRITDAGGLHPAADTVVNFNVASGGGGGTGYYSKVNTSSPSQLRCSLHATIKGHTAYPYSGGTTNTWTILEIADEDPLNSGRILDVYRNRSYAKVTDRAGASSTNKYNREHTWPKSLGFSAETGNLGLPNSPHTDTHMLYLSDANYNADRGNKPYGNCSGCTERVTEVYNGAGGGSGVYPGNSNWFNGSVFQTWGKRKGDMARAVLYMAIRYEGGTHPTTGQNEPDLELTDNASLIVATSSSPAYMGLLSTLLAWHQADPPDAAEVARNEVIYSFQGNRNPFIDHPEWATSSLFTSAKPASCQLN